MGLEWQYLVDTDQGPVPSSGWDKLSQGSTAPAAACVGLLGRLENASLVAIAHTLLRLA